MRRQQVVDSDTAARTSYCLSSSSDVTLKTVADAAAHRVDERRVIPIRHSAVRICSGSLCRRDKLRILWTTPANEIAEVMWYPLSVCICLSVCRTSQKLLTDLNHILLNDRSSSKDQSIKFWNWSGSGPGSMIIFLFLQHGETLDIK